MEKDSLYSAIKAARRRRFLFGYKNLYRPISGNSEEELHRLELEAGFVFPTEIREALLALGGCSVDDLNIHPAKTIYRFDAKNGKMSGFVAFASDIFGNYLAFDPSSATPEQVYYYSHDPLGWSAVSPSFSSYLQSFVSSGFNALSLTESLSLNEC